MFIANLNVNNDSRIGKFAGNRLNRFDVIRQRSDVITTIFSYLET